MIEFIKSGIHWNLSQLSNGVETFKSSGTYNVRESARFWKRLVTTPDNDTMNIIIRKNSLHIWLMSEDQL